MRKTMQTCLIIELYTLFHEQAVCGRCTKWKKTYLINMSNIAMWLNHFLAGSEITSLLFKEQR